MTRKSAGLATASVFVAGMILVSGCMEGGDRASGRVGDEVNSSVRVEGAGVDLYQELLEKGGLPIQLRGENASVTIDKGQPFKLVVYPAGGGDPVEFTKLPLAADFRSEGRVLTVTWITGQAQPRHFFYEPIHWVTVAVEKESEGGTEED